MNENSYKVLRPRYYDKFSCIMTECEYDCCSRRWAVPIDKATYDKFKTFENPQFKQIVDENVKLIKDAKDDEFSFAHITAGKNGLCPFRTNEGLCMIHRDFGEQYLGSTCRTYPRCHRAVTDDYSELSVSMSCPEAVRAALFDETPMDFVMDMMVFNDENPLYTHITEPAEFDNKTNYLPYAEKMRDAAITIMQLRTCPIAYRFVIIAMMLYDVKDLHDSGREEEIPDTLERYCYSEYNESFISGLTSTPINDDIHRQMFVVLQYAIKGESSHPQSTIFDELLSNAGISGEIKHSTDDAAAKERKFYDYVTEKADLHWDTFIDGREYVLENFFVSYMFTEIFPVRYLEKGLDPYHHIFLIAQQYAMLKMFLCGNYDETEGFSDTYITKIITQLALVSQHTGKMLKMAEGYRNAGLSSPAHLYYLVKE